MNQLQETQRMNSAEIYNDAITKLRSQVWLALMIICILAIVTTRILRIRDGYTDPTPLGNVLIIIFGIIITAGIALRNTPIAPALHNIFLIMVHVNVPISLLLFGGAQGIGDITLFGTVIISVVFGWRRWMFAALSVSILALGYVIYLDVVGRPLEPLVADISRLGSIKMILFIGLVLMCLYSGYQFYSRLLMSYSNYASEQVAVNQLLRTNATQLGQFNDAIRLSRQNIVAAREEERRRLRRDLHDGLGPTLAAQVFRVGAARNLYQKQPAKADHFLTEIEASVSGSVLDVRRLVDELRPSQLDQLGLVGAIRDYVNRLTVPFHIELDLTEQPLELLAAVDVAVWRIVHTAIDNVARHADASTCWVSLALEPANTLALTIADDGSGMDAEARPGVGLSSMQERCEELRGHFSVSPRLPTGTLVIARFPLAVGERAA